jgi:membrane protein DedA with SNARE-associated domain
MHQFFEFLLSITADIGYLGIVFLMAIESSFIPFPSEIVIPPAAYLAALGEMNIFFVIASGILGSLLGAVLNYYLAFTLGRKIIYALVNKKIAKLFLLDEHKLRKAEEYFIANGKASTFIGRLVPAIRQLISIPAGFSQMKLREFVFFTFLGSGLWTIILAVLGYFFGAQQEVLNQYYKEISIFAILVGIGFVIYLFRRSRREINEN